MRLGEGNKKIAQMNGLNGKIYAYINNQLTSPNGFVLEKVLIYKKFDDEIITLTSNTVIVYTGSNNQGIVSFKELIGQQKKVFY